MRTCPTCSLGEPGPWHVRGVLARPGVVAPPPVHVGCCGCALCTATLAEAGGLTGQPLLDHLAAQRAARTEGLD